MLDSSPYPFPTTHLLLLPVATLIIVLYLLNVSAHKMPTVLSVGLSNSHDFSKQPTSSINLVKGLGVEGDAHFGLTVQHSSRMHIKPPPANLRQVHLLPYEVLKPLDLKPSEIGENVTTNGIELLTLGRGTKLHFLPPANGDIKAAGAHPVVVITGLRNPCPLIEKYRKGLQEKFVVRDAHRTIVARKAGVMSVVEVGGLVDRGMRIVVEKPAAFVALECV